MPRVLNLKDTKGKVPAGAVYVGRAMPRYGLPQSKWANPYKVKPPLTRADAITLYESRAELLRDMGHDFADLRGKDLACWCSPLPCHADVLLRLANEEAPE